MTKFKLNEHVRIGPENGGYVHNAATGLVPGGTGIVCAIYFDGMIYSVLPDLEPFHYGSLGVAFATAELEKLEPEDGLDEK